MSRIGNIIKSHPEYEKFLGEIIRHIENAGLTEETLGNLPAFGRTVAGYDVYKLLEYIQEGLKAKVVESVELPQTASFVAEDSSGTSPAKKKKGD